MGNSYGCPCIPNPIWIPPPPFITQPPQPSKTPAGPPPIEDPWFVVGLYESDDCGFGGCSRDYGLGAMDMNTGVILTSENTGVTAHSTNDLCGANIGGAIVICQGDITQECQAPGVALYNSRTCRTYCPSLGDNGFAWDIFDGDVSITLSTVLVCDRALS